MSDKLIQAQDVFLSKINQICSKFGLNNIMAQLYALLYLQNKTMSLDEMADRLKISKGSVSVNIRVLERYGAVRKAWVKGSRRDYYEAETDISKVIMDRVKSLVQGRLLEMEDMVESSYKALSSASVNNNLKDSESIKIFEKRLIELKSLKSKAEALFNVLNSGLLNDFLSTQELKNKAAKEAELVI